MNFFFWSALGVVESYTLGRLRLLSQGVIRELSRKHSSQDTNTLNLEASLADGGFPCFTICWFLELFLSFFCVRNVVKRIISLNNYNILIGGE